VSTPEFLKRLERKFRAKRDEVKRAQASVRALADMSLFQQVKQLQAQSPNPLNAFGKKCFSQTDEDGITLEILRRIGLLADGAARGTYAEIGVGDGMENNTLVLAALGWKGFWIGGEALKPQLSESAKGHFSYLRGWVTLENLLDLFKRGLADIASPHIDVLSLDLDGNDIYFAEKLLAAAIAPKLFIVEYNAKFPPPVEFQIAYDAAHVWRGDDYFGASLASFVKLFARFGYRLVCCNAHSGSNAFFVQEQFAKHFEDVPADWQRLYVEPRYWLYRQYGHAPAVKTVERILNGSAAA
jgi:hypothetical protein